jgi:DNA-binding NarL/FixJ family response regulator
MSQYYPFLTQREFEILALLAQGKRNCEIAYRLSITENTVETHLKHIFQKIKVSNRVQAAIFFNSINNKINGIP